jgi:hypothetical protein
MKRNPRQARFKQELKRLLRRGVPAAKAMKQAWKRVPKNPRRRPYSEAAAKRRLEKGWRAIEKRSFFCPTCKNWQLKGHKHNPLTRRKARTILHHGRVRGRELTPAQRGLFGARASGYALRDYPALNPPPIKLFANGRLVGLIGFRPTRGRKVARNPRIDIRV